MTRLPTSTSDLLATFRTIAARYTGSASDLETVHAIRETLEDRDTDAAREALAEVDAWLA